MPILEPKPVQKPHPPVLIAGADEQMTLLAVARLGDACNIVDGDLVEAQYKLSVLLQTLRRGGPGLRHDRKDPYPTLAACPHATALAAKRERLASRGPLSGFVGTVAETIDLIGQYQDAGVDMLINAGRLNDEETRELIVSDVIPHSS